MVPRRLNGSLGTQASEIFAERLTKARIRKGQLDIGLQVAQAVASIVMLAFEAQPEKRIVFAK
jgi:hypothetical protein